MFTSNGLNEDAKEIQKVLVFISHFRSVAEVSPVMPQSVHFKTGRLLTLDPIVSTASNVTSTYVTAAYRGSSSSSLLLWLTQLNPRLTPCPTAGGTHSGGPKETAVICALWT